jgi:negative regulator of sigma E activity
MSKKVSELLDGQLDAHETGAVLKDLYGDRELRDNFTIYGLIGDVLRGNSTPDDGYSKRIFERIRREGVEPTESFDPLKDEL